MKLSLISEATIDQVQQRMPIWINKYFNGDVKQAQELIPKIIEADPTKGKYSEWLIKQWRDGKARYPEDTSNLNKNLTIFNQKKSKLEQKDIGKYTPGSLAKALDQQFGLTKSERKNARKGSMQLPPGAELIITDGEFKVIKITSPKASSLLCSGTEWCTANEETADEHISTGPLYLFYEGGVRKYLVHIGSWQFMDIYNDDVDDDVEERLFEILRPEVKSIAANAFGYADKIDKGRWPEGEPAITTDPRWAFKYAREIIDGRWPEGEPAIAADPHVAYSYAKNVIRGRWLDGEAAIAKSPSIAFNYIRDFIRGRWLEAEPAIAADPSIAFYYASDIIKGRWPEGEAAIATDPDAARNYKEMLLKRSGSK